MADNYNSKNQKLFIGVTRFMEDVSDVGTELLVMEALLDVASLVLEEAENDLQAALVETPDEGTPHKVQEATTAEQDARNLLNALQQENNQLRQKQKDLAETLLLAAHAAMNAVRNGNQPNPSFRCKERVHIRTAFYLKAFILHPHEQDWVFSNSVPKSRPHEQAMIEAADNFDLHWRWRPGQAHQVLQGANQGPQPAIAGIPPNIQAAGIPPNVQAAGIPLNVQAADNDNFLDDTDNSDTGSDMSESYSDMDTESDTDL